MTPDEARDYLGITPSPATSTARPDLDALEAAHAKATAGPWKVYQLFGPDDDQEICVEGNYATGGICVMDGNANAAAIVALHNAFLTHLAYTRALEAEVAALRGALDGIAVYGDDTLSGPVSEAAYRHWHRDGVRTMRDRARAALAASGAA